MFVKKWNNIYSAGPIIRWTERPPQGPSPRDASVVKKNKGKKLFFAFRYFDCDRVARMWMTLRPQGPKIYQGHQRPKWYILGESRRGEGGHNWSRSMLKLASGRHWIYTSSIFILLHRYIGESGFPVTAHYAISLGRSRIFKFS